MSLFSIKSHTAMGTTANCRPLSSRNHRFSRTVAHWLTQQSITPQPNFLPGHVFAAAGAFPLALPSHPAAWINTVLMIQLRLLCNLFDGMVGWKAAEKLLPATCTTNCPTAFPTACCWWPWAMPAAGRGWVGWRAAGRSCGLYPCFRRQPRPAAKFPRAAGQTTPHGRTHLRLTAVRAGAALLG